MNKNEVSSDKFKTTYTELREDMKIDKNNLENECEEHTLLYAKWSARLARANDNVRRCETELATYKARTLIEEKDNGGSRKRSDALASAGYRVRSEYTELNRKLSRLQSLADLYQSAVHAMLHRRDMLTNLVRLNTTDYYSQRGD